MPARLGRYELLGKLATGGMAEIYLARLAGEAGFSKAVVVKRLLPELVASPTYVDMFLAEGKLVARLDHPNICEVHELGRDGADYFLAMPYLDGVPVTTLIGRPRDGGARARQLRVAAGVIAQACAGLHHAHELCGTDGASLGLVHRDVSPSNLFVTAAGVVKVLDFGIAKVRGTAETELGTVKGKSQYMAPEQLLGEPLDRRCDVFALGIVLFELATHQRLFKRSSDYLAARAILEDPIPRADAADPAVPAALADAIGKALARRRDDRFDVARALAAAVTAALGGVADAAEIAAAVRGDCGEELSAQRTRQARVLAIAPATAMTTALRVVPAKQGRRWLVIALAVVVVGGVGGVAAVALTGHGDRGASTRNDATVAVAAGDAGASPLQVAAAIDAGPVDVKIEDAGAAAIVVIVDAAVRPATHPTGHPHAAPGEVSIDSTPYANVAIDGRAAGITPLLHTSLPAGHHRIRLTLRDGRSRDVDVDVPAGRAAAPVNAHW